MSDDRTFDTTLAVVRDIWADLLEYDDVAPDDNFFELGGFSILAIQVVSEVRDRLDVGVDLRLVFDHPVLRDFVEQLPSPSAAPPEGRGMPDEPATGVHPVTVQQQSMLAFLDGPGRGLDYDLVWRFALDGDVDPVVLDDALVVASEAQPTLRTRVTRAEGGTFLQVVGDATTATFDRTEGTRSVIDVDLFGCDLTPARPDRPASLVLRASHVAFDGWSLGLLLQTLDEAFGIVLRRRPYSGLRSAPRMLYTNYARWQHQRQEADDDRTGWAWWDEALSGYASPPGWLPTLVARAPVSPSFAAQALVLQLGADVTGAVSGLARRLGVTPFCIYLACFGVVVQAAKDELDVVVGSSTSSRHLPSMSHTIGYVANGRLTRFGPGPRTPRALVRSCSEWWTTTNAFPEIHMEQIVDRSGDPAFLDAKFTLQDAPGSAEPSFRLGEVRATLATASVDNAARRPLDVTATPRSCGGAELKVVFRPDTLRPEGASAFLQQLARLIAAFTADPDADLGPIRDTVRATFVAL